jgi:ribosome-binding factor A
MTRGHKPPSQRQLRVGEELRHAIAAVIERGDFRDPDLAGRAITVTEVRVSPDLHNATVFVVPLGGGDVTPILKGLKRAKAFLRQQVGRAVMLRTVPNLSFEADTSFDEATRIDGILRSPEVSRDLSAPRPAIGAGPDEDEDDFGADRLEGRDDGA